VAGAGPAGCISPTRQAPASRLADPRVEQNPADSTFGFGVVFSDRALEFLRDDDAETYERITPQMEMWTDLVVAHRGVPVRIDGIGFAAIGRLKFLLLLQKQLAGVGIIPEFHENISSKTNCKATTWSSPPDGVNSFVRRAHGDAFGHQREESQQQVSAGSAYPRFETLTQTFVENEAGTFNAHHYRHAAGDEHLRRRMRRRDLEARRPCPHG